MEIFRLKKFTKQSLREESLFIFILCRKITCNLRKPIYVNLDFQRCTFVHFDLTNKVLRAFC